MARTPSPWYWNARQSWFVTIKGKRINLGADEAAAQRRFGELTRALRGQAERAPRTLATLIPAYLAWYQATRSKGSHEVTKGRLARFARDFGAESPSKLAPGRLEQWANEQADWTPTTRRGILTVIQSCMNWAVRERIISTNPIAGIRKPSAEARTILLGDEDHARILGASKPDLRIIISLLEDTGCRPDIICQISAKGIDWARGIFRGHSKSHPYILYLSDGWLEFFAELAKAYPDGPLLRTVRGVPWTAQNIRNRMQKVGEQLSIKLFPYQYRHRFCTRKLAEGVSPAIVAELLNHTDLSMISRFYGHVNQRTDILREQASHQDGPI